MRIPGLGDAQPPIRRVEGRTDEKRISSADTDFKRTCWGIGGLVIAALSGAQIIEGGDEESSDLRPQIAHVQDVQQEKQEGIGFEDLGRSKAKYFETPGADLPQHTEQLISMAQPSQSQPPLRVSLPHGFETDPVYESKWETALPSLDHLRSGTAASSRCRRRFR